MSLLYNDYHARINSLIWDNGKPKYGDETQIEQLQQWSSVPRVKCDNESGYNWRYKFINKTTKDE